jgi:hypothetical protein
MTLEIAQARADASGTKEQVAELKKELKAAPWCHSHQPAPGQSPRSFRPGAQVEHPFGP